MGRMFNKGDLLKGSGRSLTQHGPRIVYGWSETDRSYALIEIETLQREVLFEGTVDNLFVLEKANAFNNGEIEFLLSFSEEGFDEVAEAKAEFVAEEMQREENRESF